MPCICGGLYAEVEETAQLVFIDSLDDGTSQVGRQVVVGDQVEHGEFTGEQVGATQSDMTFGVQSVQLEKELQSGASCGQLAG